MDSLAKLRHCVSREADPPEAAAVPDGLVGRDVRRGLDRDLADRLRGAGLGIVRYSGKVTAAERAHDPGPGWRKATVYDRPLPDTYVKVVSGGTQQFWVLDGERGLVAGDRVRFNTPYGDQGIGVVRVAQPERLLIAVDSTETRGAFEQWLSPTMIERIPDEEDTHD